MAWAAVAGAAIGVVGSQMGSKGGGGAQTASKEPWGDAAPWLRENLRIGQDLQGKYAQNPFSPLQMHHYATQFINSDDQRNFARSIMAQMNQRQGFDRNNSSARPAPYQMPLPSDRQTYQQLHQLSPAYSPFTGAVMQPTAPLPVAAAAPVPNAGTWDAANWQNHFSAGDSGA